MFAEKKKLFLDADTLGTRSKASDTVKILFNENNNHEKFYELSWPNGAFKVPP